MDTKRLIQNLKNNWRNCNNATTEFLQAISNEDLNKKPFDPRFKSFNWEFACLLRTRICYLEGLKTGKLSFADIEGLPDKNKIGEFSKTEMLDKFSELSNALLEEIDKLDTAEKVNMINWLLQHERIHHGKLTLYHSQSGHQLPESFKKTWGESNF